MPSSAWSSDVCRSEEHTSELQSLTNLVCRLLLEKKQRITFVPSIGYLPDGHRSPLAVARDRAERVIASFSVDPVFFFFFKDRAPPEFTPFPHPRLLRD